MLIILCVILSVLADDYYKLLEVDRNADDKTIKKSFKKLSLQFHPDRGNHNTQDYYMKLSQAYEVLTNAAKREVYDKYGEEGITIGGLKYNVEEIYDNYFGQDYAGKSGWYNFLYQGSPVIELTEHNIRALHNRKDLWVVQFYGSNSRKSREFTGLWNNLAKRMEGLAKVAAANCDVNEDFCRSHNVKKYPVVKIFLELKGTGTGTGGEGGEEEVVLYSGNKDFRSINDYVIDKLPGKLENLRFANFNQFLASDPNVAKIVLFWDNKETWSFVKSVARMLEGKVAFGEVKMTETDLVKKYEVKAFPTLVAITGNGFEKYEGKFFKASIKEWAEGVVSSHKTVSITLELDQEAFNNGNCGINDSRFCFVAFDPDNQMREVLTELVLQFTNDPVVIYWSSSKAYPLFYQAFNTRNLIIRGKKKRFSVVECQSSDLMCFVEALSNSLSGSRQFHPIKSEIRFSQSSEL